MYHRPRDEEDEPPWDRGGVRRTFNSDVGGGHTKSGLMCFSRLHQKGRLQMLMRFRLTLF